MGGKSVSGVILAAGRSARLGRPKQLLPLGGEPLLAHVLRNAGASTLAEVVLVLGHEAEAVSAAVGEWGQRTVVNPDYGLGQSTSVRAGLGAVGEGVGAVLFLLGDQPGVGPGVIDAVIARYGETGGPVVAARYGGVLGNPVLFDRAVFPEIDQLAGDEGARVVVRARPERVVAADVAGDQPPADVDTEEDYAALLAEWGARGG